MIRLLNAHDIEALVALDTATNTHPWNRAQWQDSLAQHLCLGLETEGKLAAFAVTMILPDEAELLLIAVDPARQRHGLGRTLLTALYSELATRQCTQLFLEVRESNSRARHFYTHAGMNEIGRRKHYYPAIQGREDALLLAGVIQ